MTQPPAISLADLRREIDRLDEAMHRLLMERGRIIETLIAVKKTGESGSAFRPGREADIMRRLAERHEGILPLDTAESIWRVIISTFTYVQAPYRVHADVAAGDAPMRDVARFHFGFTVPLLTHYGAAAVIEAVAASAGDLGIFRVDASASGAWWRGLEGADRPKVIARLPFIERPDHPAGTPVYVIAKPLADAAMRDVTLAAVRVERWTRGLAAAIAAIDGSIEGNAGDVRGLSLLVAATGENALGRIAGALAQAGCDARGLVEVGSHARRFDIGQKGQDA